MFAFIRFARGPARVRDFAATRSWIQSVDVVLATNLHEMESLGESLLVGVRVSLQPLHILFFAFSGTASPTSP